MVADATLTRSSRAADAQYQPLISLLAATVVGIVLDRYWPISQTAWWMIAALCLLVWLVLTWQRHNILAGYAILLAAGAVAGGWHHCHWYLYPADEIGRFAREEKQPVCIDVVALSSPRTVSHPAFDPLRVRPIADRWQFEAEAVALRDGTQWRTVSGRVQVRINGEPPTIGPGDRVRCFAQLSTPLGPRNPGEFDWAALQRSRRILAQIQVEMPECITVLSRGGDWSISRLLERLRRHNDQVLSRYLSPREAELASAVLLGLREEIDRSRSEAFMTTGTIHFLSISGLHVGILAWAMFWLARKTPIPQTFAAIGIAAVVILYALMVDAEPPVIRATFLVLVACAAACMGRRMLGMNSLAGAALVVLAVNPAHVFHVGAQLSFLCVAGLIWLEAERPRPSAARKTIDRLILRNLGWLERTAVTIYRSTVGVMQAGLVLWLLCLPLVMARFHILSVVAIFLNGLLWIPMSLSVLCGFGTLVFGTIFPPLGAVFGWLCGENLQLLEWAIGKAHQWRGGHWWVSGPADWWLLGFYGGLVLLWAFPQLRPSRRWCAGIFVGWIAIGLVPSLWPHDRDRLDCTFLSMGHGCAVLLELPSGKTLLYDAGEFGDPSRGARNICGVLWERGIRRLDAVVLSHPDVDHYNALPGVMEKFPVGEVCVSPAMFRKKGRTVKALRAALDAQHTPIREIHGGDRLMTDGDCIVEVLHPSGDSVGNNGNADSVVLAVRHHGREVLLPGDLEQPGLGCLLRQEPRHCDVLLAPHHGSRASNMPALAAWCMPSLVIFSGDGRWSTPEIEAPYRAVGVRVLHTHTSGAIQVQIDSKGVRTSTFVIPQGKSSTDAARGDDH